MTVIVDTNVAVVANGGFEDASQDCKQLCIDSLEEITTGKVKLALDDQRRIIEEYHKNLNPDGQPGVGNAFLKWVEMNWTNCEHCDRVTITPIEDSAKEFKEFPDDPDLQKLNPKKDRKFIAVAIAHCEKPPILQAVDSKWLDFRDALHQHGVRVEFICKEDIQRLHDGD